MKKKHGSTDSKINLYRALLFFSDMVLIKVMFFLTYEVFVKYRQTFVPHLEIVPATYGGHLWLLLLIYPIWIVLLIDNGGYNLGFYFEPNSKKYIYGLIKRLAFTNIVGLSVLSLILFVTRPQHTSRFLVLSFSMNSLFAFLLMRVGMRFLVRWRSAKVEHEVDAHPSADRAFGWEVRTRHFFFFDIVSVTAALFLSTLLRFESIHEVLSLLWASWYLVLIALFARLCLNFAFELYSRMWRYAGVLEGLQIVKAVSIGSIVVVAANFAVLIPANMSKISSYAIFSMDWLLNLTFLAGSRLLLRMSLSYTARQEKLVQGRTGAIHRVLIVGAGDVGEMIARLIKNNPELGQVPVGFVDDDPAKQVMYLQGVPVLGSREALPRLIEERAINEVIVGMPRAAQEVIDDLIRVCASKTVPIRVIPSIHSLITGTMTFEELRQWRPSEKQKVVAIDSAFRGTHSETFLRTIMVTGGAGFIGSNFVRYFLEAHPKSRVVVYDKLTYAGNRDNLANLDVLHGDRFAFVMGDICKQDQLAEAFEKYEIDAVVNFAAETHVDRSLLTPSDFVATNIDGTHLLLEAARKYGIKRFHQVSTDEVYGQVARGSFAEEDPLETRSPYSATKAGGDLLVQAYKVSFGLPTTITRGSNNIGPYQYPEKAVPLFITNAIDDLPIPVYGDGLYVRDYQYVIDHCRGIDLVLHKGELGEVYNLGGGNEVAAIDLARIILDKLKKPHSLIHLVRDREGQDRRYSLNCSKIKSLGWSPNWTFDKAIDSTIEWYLQNEWWWRKLKSGEYSEFYDRQYRQRIEKAVRDLLSG